MPEKKKTSMESNIWKVKSYLKINKIGKENKSDKMLLYHRIKSMGTN